MDLKVEDKDHYYIFNDIEPVFEPPEIERYKHIYEPLTYLYKCLEDRHFLVQQIDVKFYVRDVDVATLETVTERDLLAKKCRVSTVLSEKFNMYCFFGSYFSTIQIGKYCTQYDPEDDSLNVMMYCGHDWQSDKKTWFKGQRKTLPHITYKTHQREFYACLKEMAILLQDVIYFVNKQPKQKGKFSFKLPKPTPVDENWGTHIVHVNIDTLEKILLDKSFVLSGGCRMFSLSERLPEGAPEMLHDGFIYLSTINSELDLDEKTMDNSIQVSYKCRYPLVFKPKKSDGLYVLNRNLSKEEAVLKLMPMRKYDGRFDNFQIISHREILGSELELPLWYYKELYETMINSENWKYTNDEKEIVARIIKKFS